MLIKQVNYSIQKQGLKKRGTWKSESTSTEQVSSVNNYHSIICQGDTGKILYKISFWLPYSHDKDDNINNNDKNEDDDDDDDNNSSNTQHVQHLDKLYS